MGELVDLEKVKEEKELQRLHEISRRVVIVDDDGNEIATIYHPFSPMGLKQELDNFKRMLDARFRDDLCAITIVPLEPPTLWERIKRLFGGVV